MSNIKTADIQVDYVDHMGSDLNVINAARVSFAKEVQEFDLEKDTKLINYLAKHNHWSPLAHTSITIRIKAPIFAARQYVKHQIGLVWNEESRRYIDSEPEFYIPTEYHGKPNNAKQGSSEEIIETCYDSYIDTEIPTARLVRNICEASLGVYELMLQNKVAPEEARIVLPLNTMTNWMWTGSLVAFARVCKLRLDGHAQKMATQELAQKIHDVVAPLYPVSWKALMDNN